MARKKLKDKHVQVINEYFNNGYKKGKAMLAGGYNESTSKYTPGLVFDRPDVIAEINRRKKALAKKYELNQDWVIKRLMRFAMSGETLAKYKKVDSDGSLYWDFSNASEEDLALIQEMGVDFYTEGRGKNSVKVKKFKVKSQDAHAALIALSRHLGLFNDSVELKGSLVERIQAGRNRASSEES